MALRGLKDASAGMHEFRLDRVNLTQEYFPLTRDVSTASSPRLPATETEPEKLPHGMPIIRTQAKKSLSDPEATCTPVFTGLSPRGTPPRSE